MLEAVVNCLEKMLMGLEMHLASLLHLSFIRSVSYGILLCLWWYLKLVIVFLTFVHTNHHGAQDFWQSFSEKCMYLEYDWLLTDILDWNLCEFGFL